MLDFWIAMHELAGEDVDEPRCHFANRFWPGNLIPQV
jgi:hypothetical protein